PSHDRVFYIRYAFQQGFTVREVYELTKIDPWFLEKIKNVLEFEEKLKSFAKKFKLEDLPTEILREAKRLGFSDKQLAHIFHTNEFEVRRIRKAKGVKAVYKMVDTCAAEFEAKTPYYYSTYEDENDAVPTKR
ncbi:MAG: carbamoyl phosphate synthase large subunit, partial [Archaeoglobaceae archaeon]